MVNVPLYFLNGYPPDSVKFLFLMLVVVWFSIWIQVRAEK